MDGTHAASRDRIKALYAERSVMESEMAEIAQRLSGPGMPGLRGSLVDGEGFPIPGVDLYAVRRGTLFFLFLFFGAKQSIPNTRAFPLSPLSLSLSPSLSCSHHAPSHEARAKPPRHATPCDTNACANTGASFRAGTFRAVRSVRCFCVARLQFFFPF